MSSVEAPIIHGTISVNQVFVGGEITTTSGGVATLNDLSNYATNNELNALNTVPQFASSDEGKALIVQVDNNNNPSVTWGTVSGGGGSGGSTYEFSPGEGFSLWHSVSSSGGLMNLWTHPGMHSNTSLSQLGSATGESFEVYFRICTLNQGLKEIYYKGFDLSKAFNKDEVVIFHTGNEMFKRTAGDAYVPKPGAIHRVYDFRTWVFGDSDAIPNESTTNIANELVFNRGDDPYDSYVIGADIGNGQGLMYTAQVWVKPA